MGKGSTTCTGGAIAPSMTQGTMTILVHLVGGAGRDFLKGASALFLRP